MDLSDVEKLHIFDIISVNDKQDFLVNFYGFRMGLDDHMLDKLYKLFIREMDPLLRYGIFDFQELNQEKVFCCTV